MKGQMKARTLLVLISTLVLLVSGSSLALSDALADRDRPAGVQPAEPGYTYVRYHRGPHRRGRVCRKLCAFDRLPCDPLYFKLADGRCNRL
jgi:hypothetical protein